MITREPAKGWKRSVLLIFDSAPKWGTVENQLEVRPIYHHRDNTSIGHIVASFLALRLEVDLQRRLDEREVSIPWPDLMTDLKKIHAVLIELEGTRHRLRTAMQGASLHAFHSSGARIPASVTSLDELP